MKFRDYLLPNVHRICGVSNLNEMCFLKEFHDGEHVYFKYCLTEDEKTHWLCTLPSFHNGNHIAYIMNTHLNRIKFGSKLAEWK